MGTAELVSQRADALGVAEGADGSSRVLISLSVWAGMS